MRPISKVGAEVDVSLSRRRPGTVKPLDFMLSVSVYCQCCWGRPACEALDKGQDHPPFPRCNLPRAESIGACVRMNCVQFDSAGGRASDLVMSAKKPLSLPVGFEFAEDLLSFLSPGGDSFDRAVQRPCAREWSAFGASVFGPALIYPLFCPRGQFFLGGSPPPPKFFLNLKRNHPRLAKL